MRAGLLACCALLAAAPATAADEAADITAARKFASPVLATTCLRPTGPGTDVTGGDHVFEVRYRTPWQDQDSPDEGLTLVQLRCSSAQGKQSAIFVARRLGGTWSLLSFAEPVLDYDYANEAFTRLKSPPALSGYASRYDLANAEFLPAAKTIKATATWRASGDAWSAGEWTLVNGTFMLTRYEVDPTFDGVGGDRRDPQSYVIFDAGRR